jgi:hypothetical protein
MRELLLTCAIMPLSDRYVPGMNTLAFAATANHTLGRPLCV